MNIPQVSVIIPTFNSGSYLSATLESVFTQTFRDFEVVVVDDGSTDETDAILKSFKSRIIHLTHERNRGPSAAVNTGVHVARGEFLAFLDADDLWHADKIARQIKLFETHPEVGFCFTNYTKFGIVQSNESGFDERNQAMRSYPRRQIDNETYVITSESLLKDLLVVQAFPMPSSIMVRRSAFMQACPLDEELAYQDLQLILRMAKFCTFAYIDACLVDRRIHSESLSNTIGVTKFLHMHIATLDRLSSWFELSREEKRAAHVLEAGYQRAAGYLAFNNYELSEARRHFWLSMRRNFTTQSLVYFLPCLFPRAAVKRIRFLKQWVAKSQDRKLR